MTGIYITIRPRSAQPVLRACRWANRETGWKNGHATERYWFTIDVYEMERLRRAMRCQIDATINERRAAG